MYQKWKFDMSFNNKQWIFKTITEKIDGLKQFGYNDVAKYLVKVVHKVFSPPLYFHPSPLGVERIEDFKNHIETYL